MDSAARLGHATTRLALALLALCCVLPVASAVAHLDRGEVILAGAICLGTGACAAVARGWWSRRGHRSAAVWAVGLLALSTTTWVAAGNLLGMAPVVLGVATVVSSLGVGAGIGVGVLITVALSAVYVANGADPEGGVIGNTVVVLLIVVSGALLAHLVDRLHDALGEVLAGQRLRQQAALEQLDAALVQDRMLQAEHLHDELGQRLTVIGMGLDIAARSRGRGSAADPDGPAWEEIDRTREESRAALEELRRLVRALSPGPGAGPDLAASLARLEQTFNSTGLQVRIRQHAEQPNGEMDGLAYRIIQEGLTNVVRHSDARRVWIDLDYRDSETSVSVTDDGRGTGSRPDPVDRGFGLEHLATRVEMAGGHLDTRRTADGFALVARYPRRKVDA